MENNKQVWIGLSDWKQYLKKGANILILVSICIILTSCQKQEEKEVVLLETADNISEEISEVKIESEVFPYFCDDTPKQLQTKDGYLYGYWGGYEKGVLCRYDTKTLEEEVLFSTTGDTRTGHFCIYQDYIYFMEKSGDKELADYQNTILYRMKCDGTQLSVLAEELLNASEYYLPDGYEIDIYEDVIYLLEHTPNGISNLYFQLQEDGSVIEIAEEETLYGMLAEGYNPSVNLDIPSFPYAARNYGCIFAENEEGELVRISLKGNEPEKIGISSDADMLFTHDTIYYCEDAVNKGNWYRCGLSDVQDKEAWINKTCDEWNSYDEEGVFLTSRSETEAEICKIDKEGTVLETKTILFSPGKDAECYYAERLLEGKVNDIKWEKSLAEGFKEIYIEDSYIYYCDRDSDERMWNMEVKRLAWEEKEEPESVAEYYPMKVLNVLSETENVSYEAVSETLFLETRIEELYISCDDKIYQFLQEKYGELYDLREKEIEKYCNDERYGRETDVENQVSNSCFITDAEIQYYDGFYIGIEIEGYECWFPDNPICWSDYYVFDRNTRERVSVTDVTALPEETIIELVMAQAEKEGEGHYSIQEESILEPDRFFLTEEGFGIHYDPGEAASFMNGDVKLEIPYLIMKRE